MRSARRRLLLPPFLAPGSQLRLAERAKIATASSPEFEEMRRQPSLVTDR
jgi:hypothetical protein